MNFSVPLSTFADPSTTPSSTSSTSIPTPQSATFPLDAQDHPKPVLPSTFLPSYYPDSRDRIPLLPSQQTALDNQNKSRTASTSTFHNPAAVDRISAQGPSNRHLLDGVALHSPPPRPDRPTSETPTFELSPGAYVGSLPSNLGSSWSGAGMKRTRGEWNDMSFIDPLLSGVGGGSAHASSSSNPFSGSSSSPHTDGPNGILSSLSQGASNGLGDGPHFGSRSWSDATPNSAAYPGSLFGSVALPESALSATTWNNEELNITGDDYAKALSIYENLAASIPRIQSLNHSNANPSGPEFSTLLRLAQEGAAIVSGQPVPVDTTPTAKKIKVDSTAKPASGSGSGKRSHGDKSKAATKCLGCGATETPEWRRGPMGPRTLCNACGLVHMKLQRKKKKLEEKAAALAAAKKS